MAAVQSCRLEVGRTLERGGDEVKAVRGRVCDGDDALDCVVGGSGDVGRLC